MAEFQNILDKIEKITKNNIKYQDGDFVDSPLRMAYGFRAHPEDVNKYFLTVEWNYRHRHTDKPQIYFELEPQATYQIDFEKSATTFDDIYSIILDSHKRLKAHYKTEVADTSFANLELTEPDEDDLNRKVKKIVSQDIPELNFK